MVTHLAVVEKRRSIHGTGRLQTVAIRGANGLWIKHKDVITLTVDRDRMNEGVLVLVEVNENKQILKIDLAVDEIVRSLLSFSTKTGELKQEWDNIALWRESLIYQTIELEQRRKDFGEDHQRRELSLKLQESSVKQFSKLMLEREKIRNEIDRV